MKKTYVKPVMESEEFVANEYVAACWRITCTGDGNCGTITVKDTESQTYSEGSMISTDSFNGKAPCTNEITKETFEVDTVDELLALLGETLDGTITTLKAIDILINGKEVETETSFHPLEVTKGWENHPNASV